MNRRRDERKFLIKGQRRAVAVRDEPILQAALRDLIQETVKAYGVAEFDLDAFGLSTETLESIASDLHLEIAFEGSMAILSPSN